MRSRFASNRDPSEKVDMQAQPTAYIQSRVGSRLDAILQFGGLAVVGITIAAVAGVGGDPLKQQTQGLANVTSTTAAP